MEIYAKLGIAARTLELGARSRVREYCEIAFPGAPYEQVIFVADTVATGEIVPGELNVFLWKTGFHLCFRMRGKDRWRVIGILPSSLAGQDNPSFDDVMPHLRQAVDAIFSFKA